MSGSEVLGTIYWMLPSWGALIFFGGLALSFRKWWLALPSLLVVIPNIMFVIELANMGM